jgi:hypothetical protein
MDKHIFFDLDETLLHTRMSRAESGHFGQPIVRNFGDGTTHNPVWYTSYVRPGALKLLEEVRKIVPEERIHVITVATTDYALWNNEGHGFGFHPDRIFAREHLHQKVKTERLKFPEGITPRAYLIDNLHRMELGGKLSLLHQRLGFPIDQLYTYRVDDYYGPADRADPPNPNFGAWSEPEIADIVAFIKGHGPQGDTTIPHSPWG